MTLPEILLIAGTRVALGAGIGFLLANRLDEKVRRGAGWALLAFGAVSTIPLAANVIGKTNGAASSVAGRTADRSLRFRFAGLSDCGFQSVPERG